MKKKGFLKRDIYLNYEYGKKYKIPFYHNSDNNVNITSSKNILLDKYKFNPSNKKQYVSFSIDEEKKDEAKFLVYNNESKIDKINIKFRKKSIFYLDKNYIERGVNEFIVYKDSNFIDPKVILISNKGSRKIKFSFIDNKKIKIKLNIRDGEGFFLRIKDGLKTKKIKLFFNKNKKNNYKFDFNLDVKYLDQKIYLKLNSKLPLKKDEKLNINGTINGSYIWKKGKTKKEIIFNKQILKYDFIEFNINKKKYSKLLINKNYFPKSITKTRNGIRFDKKCEEKLRIKVDGKFYIIPPNTLNYHINWFGKKVFEVYFKDLLLFKKELNMIKNIPEVFLMNNPLRIKLSNKHYEDVKVQFKGDDKKFIIPSGKTKCLIPYKEKEIKTFEILNIENGFSKKNKWKFFLK